MVYKIKHQKRVAREFEAGYSYQFIAHKYHLPSPDVFLAVERERLKVKRRKR